MVPGRGGGRPAPPRVALESPARRSHVDIDIGKGHWAPEFQDLGSLLAARLGDDYRAVGFAFDHGGFQALGDDLRLTEFTVPSAGPETLDGVLAEAVAPRAVIDLRDVPTDGPVADYFAAPPLVRDIAAGYSEDLGDAFLRPMPVAAQFDALAFVAETSRAVPTAYARDQITPQPTNPAAVNLGLDDGDVDGVPAGWFAPVANQVGGYAVATTPARPFAGAASAVLWRTPARGYGKNYGELRQRLRAVPYRGQRIRVHAMIRAITAPGARVHLWGRVGASYDGMHDRPITTSGWTSYDLDLDVSPTASTLSFGLVLVGDGAAWIDDVRITPLPD